MDSAFSKVEGGTYCCQEYKPTRVNIQANTEFWSQNQRQVEVLTTPSNTCAKTVKVLACLTTPSNTYAKTCGSF